MATARASEMITDVITISSSVSHLHAVRLYPAGKLDDMAPLDMRSASALSTTCIDIWDAMQADDGVTSCVRPMMPAEEGSRDLAPAS